MKLSIGGYSFNHLSLEGKMDVFGYLESVKFRYGLDAVDLWNAQIAERTTPLLTLADDSYLKKVREALDEKGLRLVNLAVDTAHLWDPDPDRRAALRTNAMAHLRAGVILGAETVRIDTGGYGSDRFSDEAFDHIVRGFREYCKFARDNGIRIGPENHMGPSLVPGELKRLAQAVDDPAFGILLHMGRWNEEREGGDELVAPWVFHTHFDARTAASPESAQTVAMLRRAGFDGYWAIEHNATDEPYAQIAALLEQAESRLVEAGISPRRQPLFRRGGQQE
ncbi:xylose isomerase [Cohnella sp. CIP 111063]|uniref:sugar phosphate isomerase/epimerase family protein n=1 Tax=unclassified Cohnella TaxID=2636738 RepID=UPI000B8C3D63|nr:MULTISPECIES: sugar phosphate isomerase/epimerase family protein [unclassified Cohnella]OXS57704.1 xylose isomerase [Cohnella sp. CIP 111063]PRX71097.1 sugar phosphate isomerase/epimerase [Cohnella sp. SGD-V74]